MDRLKIVWKKFKGGRLDPIPKEKIRTYDFPKGGTLFIIALILGAVLFSTRDSQKVRKLRKEEGYNMYK